MSKKLDSKKLLIGMKEFKKVDKLISNDADNIVSRIHDFPVDERKKTTYSNEATVRTTIDVPKQLHKQIRLKIADNDLSMKDYLLSLARKDLGVQ